jgi:hypothetical protein
MRTTLALALLLIAAVFSGALSAQKGAPEQASGNATSRQPAEERQAPTTNVRIELTVTDAVGGSPPVKKTVSMVVADGRPGRIRAQGAQHPSDPTQPQLSVDATPTLVGARVRLQISIEYLPPLQGAEARHFARVTEFATVLLDSAKPMMITESADPSADRKVTVEVTATILK